MSKLIRQKSLIFPLTLDKFYDIIRKTDSVIFYFNNIFQSLITNYQLLITKFWGVAKW